MERYHFPGPHEAPVRKGLPDPLQKPDGTFVTDRQDWPRQRAYLKEMMAHYLYGHMPQDAGTVSGEVIGSRERFAGRVTEETVRIRCGPGGQISFDAVVRRPNGPGRYPVITVNHFTGQPPCPVEEELCRRGYCLVMFEKDQLAPDVMGCAEDAFGGPCSAVYPEQDWRAIAMWAWGHSRLADYLVTTTYADCEKLVATGHSRCGKAAMCAAIYDERFAACVAAGSGCGGAGNFRYLGGRMGEGLGESETLGKITRCDRFWYWFADAGAAFGNREDLSRLGQEHRLPFDLHFLRALMAPRPFLVLEGLDDTWANPFGTQVSWLAAQPVYELLGAGGHNAMRFREGGHEYNREDWLAALSFLDHTLLHKNVPADYHLYGPEDAVVWEALQNRMIQ